MSFTGDDDLAKWQTWKKSKNPDTLNVLLRQLEPILRAGSRQNYGTLSNAVIDSEAKIQAVSAFKTFDPDKGVKLSTHVTNYLQKVNRLNYRHQEIFSVPENRRIQYSAFEAAKSHLGDELGRHPTQDEIATHLKWPKAEVERFHQENRFELSETQPYANDIAAHQTRDQTLVSYIFQDLTPKYRLLLEHTTGYNDKPILDNTALRKKLGMTQGQLSYAKKQLQDQVHAIRSQQR